MPEKNPDDVLAETKALIEETMALIEKNDRLLNDGMASLAELAGKKPGDFSFRDVESMLREKMTSAEFEDLMAQARRDLEATTGASTTPPTVNVAPQPMGQRRARRMV